MTKTIVFFSTKGGVGKTTLALNTAVSLSKKNKKTLLLSFDLDAPLDIAKMCNLKPLKSMVDLAPLWERAKENTEILKNTFFTPANKFLDFFPAILSLRSTPQVDATAFAGMLELFATLGYDFIIIDGGKHFNDVIVKAFDKSNLVILVVAPDVLCLYQTEWILDILNTLGFPKQMLKSVLNRYDSKGSVSPQEIKIIMPIEIIGNIASDGKAAGLALNRGVPMVLDHPTSKMSQSIETFAGFLSERDDIYVTKKTLSDLKIKDDFVKKESVDFWSSMGFKRQAAVRGRGSIEDEIITKLKRKAHQRLIEEMNLKRLANETTQDMEQVSRLKEQAEKILTNVITREAQGVVSSVEVRRRIIKEIIDEALGLGPLEDLLRDTSVTEIMVNNKDHVYIEREGKLMLTEKYFTGDEQVKIIIERILAPLGRRIDESSPYVDARLPDGSRVNAIIPPLALTGPSLTIRKFRRERFSVEELIGIHALSKDMIDFLRACVLSRKNIMVSGGTGSGKTTFLNILSSFIPENERIITIEDAAELKLDQEHWIRLESRPPNIEGKGAVTIRDLFSNTLRMRPDRIVVGECRSVEALDMLQAMNTGHDGSMSTLHANSTQDVLIRLDSMILMSGVELPIRAIREMIASAIDLIVHTARIGDGTRKVTQITEISGMSDEMHINLKDIFMFKQTHVDETGHVIGEFVPTGYIPQCLEEMKTQGFDISEKMFHPV